MDFKTKPKLLHAFLAKNSSLTNNSNESSLIILPETDNRLSNVAYTWV